jgi:hypothetical protein
MLRLSIRQAEAMFGSREALAHKTHSREALAVVGAPRLEQFLAAGVGIPSFISGGFTLNDLLNLGMCGSSFNCAVSAKTASRFVGLEGKWEALTSWSLVDLAQADATLTDFEYLGVTLHSLRARGLPGPGFVGVQNVTMDEWKGLGLVKADLMRMQLTTACYRRLGWTYQDMQRCWGFTTTDMTHIGFKLSMCLTGTVRGGKRPGCFP